MRAKTVILFTLPFWSLNVFATCDSCAKAALNSAKGAISSSVKGTSSIVKANGASIDVLNQSVTQGNQVLVQQLDLLNEKEALALSKTGMRISLELEMMAKESSANADTIVQNLIANNEQLHKADMAIDNAKLLGPSSQPLSGRINLARSPDLLLGYRVKESLTNQQIKNMNKWLNDNGYKHSKLQERNIILNKPAFWDISAFVSKSRLTSDEVNDTQSLLQILINAEPEGRPSKNVIFKDVDSVNKEVVRLRRVAIEQVSHSILASRLSNKAPTIKLSDSWRKAYFNISPDENNMISFEQFYEAETKGKLVSPQWFNDIASRSEAGLLREQINQMNTANMLLAEIVKSEREESKLLALSILQGQ